MTGESLHVRLCRGDTILELEGDAAAVQAQLAALEGEGFGRILDFFGNPAPPPRPAPGPSPAGGTPLVPIAEPALSLRFVVDRITLPHTRSDFAADLDGDGTLDNAFGGVVGTLESANIDLQGSVEAAVESFSSPLLVTFNSEFFDLTVDQRADVKIETGRVVDATDRKFAVDASGSATVLPGWLKGGRWRSQTPAEGGVAVALAFTLELTQGVATVLPLQGVQLSFTLPADGFAIADGQLTGALASSAVETALVPALAKTMTAVIAAAPESETAKTLAELFDRGGCTNPDGSEAKAGDGVIDVCELLTSPLLQAVLASDVPLADGRRDAFSVGVGFVANQATF